MLSNHINSQVNWNMIPKDKQKHLIAGLVISGTSSFIAKKLDFNRPVIIGLSLGILTGVGKELYDLTGRGDPSVLDATYTGIGSLTGCVFGIKININKKHHGKDIIRYD